MKKETEINLIDNKEFYNLMQSYRHSPLDNPAITLTAYKEVCIFVEKYITERSKQTPLTPTAEELRQMLDAGKYMKACCWSDYKYCYKNKNQQYRYCDLRTGYNEIMDGAFDFADGKTEWAEYHPPQEEQQEEVCPECGGMGKEFPYFICPTCNGTGKKPEQKLVEWKQDKLIFEDGTDREFAIESVVNNNADGIQLALDKIIELDEHFSDRANMQIESLKMLTGRVKELESRLNEREKEQ
jgi:hypothetical protein